ncbi:MAG: PAS domain S-box protein [Betaproteobacteria bacterium]|nr:PAS domain S-box protein [Betaproteobacteria bacterium]
MNHGVITPSPPSQAQTIALLGPSLDRLPLAMILSGTDGRIALANEQANAMFGWPRGSLVGEPLDSLIPERFRGAHPAYRAGFFAEPRARMMGAGRDLFARRRDGTEFPVEIGLSPVPVEGGMMVLSAIVDITERKEREAAIRRSLEEKELLLAEIHHRVKNNLQVIHSLLDLQAMRSADPGVRGILLDSQNRVRSMSLIHQTLYQSQDFARVDFDYFLHALAPGLSDSLSGGHPRVTIDVLPSGIALPIAIAIPCALIVNELVSNAYKHGYPDGRPGRIVVGLRRETGPSAILEVTNDGVPIAPEVDLEGGQSLGMTLVTLLTQQVHGTLHVRRADPVRFEIRFPLEVP